MSPTAHTAPAGSHGGRTGVIAACRAAFRNGAQAEGFPGLILRPAAVVARPFRGRSLRALALRGSAWTLGGYAASQGLRLASNLTLTRLLFPEAFGWMLATLTIVQGLQMFSDVGIGAAIVQSKRGEDPDFLRTAWTVQILRGFILWAVAAALAAPAAAFFEQPAVVWLLPIVGLQLVAAGFQSTSYHTCSRNIRLGRVTLLQLGAQAVGVVVMIAWALWDQARGVESVLPLAVGAVLTPAITTVLTHTSLPGVRHRPRWEPAAARELFSFGRWIFVSTLVTFLAMQSDRLIFGRLVDAERLGVYAIALNLALLGSSVLARLVGRVIYPACSRLLDRGKALAEHLPRLRTPISVLGAAAASGLACCAVPLVTVMYDDRYHDAAWMLQILAASVMLQAMDMTLGKALLALGHPRELAICNTARLVGLVTLLPIGFHVAGMPGAIAGIVGADVLRYAVTASLAKRRGLPAVAYDLPVMLYAAGVAAAGLAAARWVAPRLGEGLAWELAVPATVCVLLWAPWIPSVIRRLARGAVPEPAPSAETGPGSSPATGPATDPETGPAPAADAACTPRKGDA